MDPDWLYPDPQIASTYSKVKDIKKILMSKYVFFRNRGIIVVIYRKEHKQIWIKSIYFQGGSGEGTLGSE